MLTHVSRAQTCECVCVWKYVCSLYRWWLRVCACVYSIYVHYILCVRIHTHICMCVYTRAHTWTCRTRYTYAHTRTRRSVPRGFKGIYTQLQASARQEAICGRCNLQEFAAELSARLNTYTRALTGF